MPSRAFDEFWTAYAYRLRADLSSEMLDYIRLVARFAWMDGHAARPAEPSAALPKVAKSHGNQVIEPFPLDECAEAVLRHKQATQE